MNAQEIVETFMEKVWNQRQLERVNDLFPEDFVAKPIAYQPMWVGTGPESMKHHIQEWLEGVPDLQMKTIVMIAEGDRVVVQWQMTGTHNGVLYGVPATGRSITALGVTIYKIQNGKIQDLQTAFDGLGLMQQLGVLPDAGTIIQNHLRQLAKAG
jgi:steroid delta-isomerase-like uncharacterized protein